MIRVFIADDEKFIVDAFNSFLKDEDEIKVVGEAFDGKETIEKLKGIEVDVLLLDYDMPIMTGLEVCKYVDEHFPDIKTIVISLNNKPRIIKTFIDTGAVGYLTKSSSSFLHLNNLS